MTIRGADSFIPSDFISGPSKLTPQELDWKEKVISLVGNVKATSYAKHSIAKLSAQLWGFTPSHTLILAQDVHENLSKQNCEKPVLQALDEEMMSILSAKELSEVLAEFKRNPQKYHFIAIQLAVFLVKEEKMDLLEAIRTFNISLEDTALENKNALLELMKASKTLPKKKELMELGLSMDSQKGQDILIAFSLERAAQTFHFSEWIPEIGIDPSTESGQRALIEIAKRNAQHPYSSISEFIENYKINPKTKEGQQGLIEIAKIAVKNNEINISPFIKNYRIDSTEEGRQALIEIAKLSATYDGAATVSHLPSYLISANTPKGKQVLIEVLFAAAQTIDITSSLILLGIKPETEDMKKTLQELALLIAQKDAYNLLFNLHQYGIDPNTSEGQSLIIHIAKLAAQQNGPKFIESLPWLGINPHTEEGQKGFTELAKILAQNVPEYFVSNTHLFPIRNDTPEGQKAWSEIAKASARTNGYLTSMYLASFGIRNDTEDGQKILRETALLSAQNSPIGVAELIGNYGFNPNSTEGFNTLLSIAKEIAKRDGRAISSYINYFGFDPATPEGQAARIEIAKLAAKQNGQGTSEFIHFYEINPNSTEGKNALFEIAMIAAKHPEDRTGIGLHIHNYSFPIDTEDGQKRLGEIALIDAQTSPDGVAENIIYYQLNLQSKEGFKALTAIAELIAQKKGKAIARNIQKFGFNFETEEGQELLIKIAKMAAEQNGKAVALNFPQFNINTEAKSQSVLEILKIIAKKSPDAIVENLSYFGIDPSTSAGFEAMKEIAKVAANHQPTKTAISISLFGFNAETPEGQKALVEIAEIVANLSPNLARYIHLFNIKDPQALLNIAHLCAKGIAPFIEDFGIDPNTVDGQKNLIEIAKLSASLNGGLTAEYISHFKIKSDTAEGRKALFEIALLCAKNDGKALSKFINNFNLKPESPEEKTALFEIVKATLHQSIQSAQFIPNYDLDLDLEEKIELATYVAEKDGDVASTFILNFEINANTPSGQEALIKLSLTAAKNSKNGISQTIDNYSIDSNSLEGRKALNEIVRISASKDSAETARNIKKYGLNEEDLATLHPMLFDCFVEQTDFTSLTFLEDSQYFHKKNTLPFLELRKEIDQMSTTAFASKCVNICSEQFHLPKENFQWFLDAIKKTSDPFNQKKHCHWFLHFATLASMSTNPAQRFANKSLLNEIIKKEPRLRDALSKELLTSQSKQQETFLTSQQDSVVHAQLASLVLSKFPPEAQEGCLAAIAQIKGDRAFRDGKKQKLLIESLLSIKNSSLTGLEKDNLLKQISAMKSDERLKALTLINSLISFEAEEYLKGPISIKGLQTSLEAAFQKALGLKTDRFWEKYEKTIDQWRQKEALFTYAGKLNLLDNPDKEKALKFLGQYVSDILNGSFIETRYKTLNNPHLAELNLTPQLLDHWKTKLEYAEKKEESPEVMVTIKNIFIPFLQADSTTLEKVSMELKDLGIPKNLEQKERKKELTLKKNLLEIESCASEAELRKKLNDMKSLATKESPLFKAIFNVLALMDQSKKPPPGLKMVETDDPNDFLLMGTEVENSCQSVNGTPNLNVCLLGYSLDGKHRLALVKNAEGKILARSVLRLLLDENGSPVLFQEKGYFSENQSGLSEKLRELAKKKAQSLGIPLLVSNQESSSDIEPYSKIVHAKEKPVPFEYVDALAGKEIGTYQLSANQVVY